MKGEITLPVNTVRTTQQEKFYVIEGDMRYNALFGRSRVHSMRVIPSNLHQALKFPNPGGIKTLYGAQLAANEMFVIKEVIPVTTSMTSKDKGPNGVKGTK